MDFVKGCILGSLATFAALTVVSAIKNWSEENADTDIGLARDDFPSTDSDTDQEDDISEEKEEAITIGLEEEYENEEERDEQFEACPETDDSIEILQGAQDLASSLTKTVQELSKLSKVLSGRKA